jgi:hypothetical protein
VLAEGGWKEDLQQEELGKDAGRQKESSSGRLSGQQADSVIKWKKQGSICSSLGMLWQSGGSPSSLSRSYRLEALFLWLQFGNVQRPYNMLQEPSWDT